MNLPIGDTYTADRPIRRLLVNVLKITVMPTIIEYTSAVGIDGIRQAATHGADAVGLITASAISTLWLAREWVRAIPKMDDYDLAMEKIFFNVLPKILAKLRPHQPN